MFYVPDVEKVGIYMIENVETKKRYIGSTVNVKKRLKLHERELRLGYSINRLIDADIDAVHDEFFCSVLETFDDGEITDEELAQKEAAYIRQFGTGGEYNTDKSALRPRLYSKQRLFHDGNVRAYNAKKESVRAYKL